MKLLSPLALFTVCGLLAAPLMAADLDVPADRMTEVLIENVHKHISVLGEPEFNPAED